MGAWLDGDWQAFRILHPDVAFVNSRAGQTLLAYDLWKTLPLEPEECFGGGEEPDRQYTVLTDLRLTSSCGEETVSAMYLVREGNDGRWAVVEDVCGARLW